MGMPSCPASSFSHGDAFISSKPERTTTCTSSPQALRAAAAVHRGVAAAHDHARDARRVPERHARQPVDADVDVGRGLAAAGDVDVATARRSAADEHRVEALPQERLHAVDALAGTEIDAHVEHVAHLLVDDALGQAELGDLRAHHPARLAVAVEHDELVAERCEIARDRERGGTGADHRDPLAVPMRGARGEAIADVFLVVGGDALQPADRHGLGLGLLVVALLDAPAPARGLAGAVAGSTQDAGEDVRLPVDEIRVAVASRGDEADVFGNRCVGGARPLAIDDLVKVIGLRNIRRVQTAFFSGLPERALLSIGFASRERLDSPRSGFAAAMLRLSRAR